MRRGLAATALAAAAAMAAGMAQAQLPISEMSRAFARQVLGPARAATIERLDGASNFMAPSGTRIRFFTRSRPMGADMCGRTVYAVMTGPVDRGRPVTPLTVQEGLQVALAPGCRLAPGQLYAGLERGATFEMAAGWLRALSAAQASARSRDPLPFSLSCQDELEESCGDDGRAVLAAVVVAQAFAVSRDGVLIEDPSERYFAETGQRSVWTIGFHHFGEPDAQVTLDRRRPVPF